MRLSNKNENIINSIKELNLIFRKLVNNNKFHHRTNSLPFYFKLNLYSLAHGSNYFSLEWKVIDGFTTVQVFSNGHLVKVLTWCGFFQGNLMIIPPQSNQYNVECSEKVQRKVHGLNCFWLEWMVINGFTREQVFSMILLIQLLIVGCRSSWKLDFLVKKKDGFFSSPFQKYWLIPLCIILHHVHIGNLFTYFFLNYVFIGKYPAKN